MMTMLVAGGIEAVVDNIRTADTDNPNGYFELERVKQLPKGDKAWVAEAPGKVVKVISMLLKHLPDGYEYRVVFMRRQMAEILASQRAMLGRRGHDNSPAADQEMSQMFQKHLGEIETWLEQQPAFQTLYVSYNDLVKNPTALVPQIAEFLGADLDTAAMLKAVDQGLYRNRG